MTNSPLETSPELSNTRRSPRGRWLVVGLLLFGSLATASISLYWSVRLGPYAPYRRALKTAFPDGTPIVEGGNLPGEPRLLRVVLKVAFSPTAEDERVLETANQVHHIVRELDEPPQFDTLLLFLVRPQPEKTPERIEIRRELHSDVK